MPTLNVTPDPLPAGGQAILSYQSGRPDGFVTIYIDNGQPPPGQQTDSVAMSLDSSGNASAPWRVPAHWTVANFIAIPPQEAVPPATFKRLPVQQ